jgi:5'-nucleotidase
MNIKRTVLLTNDDGYSATGIKHLYDALSEQYTIIVVAPQHEQSGVGHSFTFNKALHYEKIPDLFEMNGFFVSGTPSDCVKFAISFLLPQRPDLIISGLNIGENSGLSAFYSGTVAAAREGAFWNIPSIAFSQCTGNIDYMKDYAALTPNIIKNIIESYSKMNSPDNSFYYNVNFPHCPLSEVKGTRVTWQSTAYFDDRYERVEIESHHTGEGYMVFGEKKNIEVSNGFDSRALMNKYITITPLSFDATAYKVIPYLRWLEEEDFSKR